MKIDIISGFLGAGKTTLIKKLLDEELYKEKIAIIENEYGAVSIDGSILKDENIKIKEITSGCICCSIKGDFKESILEIIKDYRPERIIIEPTGVAKLAEIVSALRDINIKGARINIKLAVVDAQNVDTYINNFGEFYKDQIINADTVIVSRSQYLSKDTMIDITKKIKNINKKCTLITTPWDEISGKKILDVCEDKEKVLLTTDNIKMYNGVAKKQSMANEIFDTYSIETPKMFKKHEINNLLKSLEDSKKYGLVLRAKGIVEVEKSRWVLFDFVPNDIKVKDFNSDYTGRICVIGKSLNKQEIQRLFLS